MPDRLSRPMRAQHPVEDLPDDVLVYPARQPLLRDRPADGRPPGRCSATSRPAGSGSRRSSTSSTTISSFGYRSCPADQDGMGRLSGTASACAAISRISRSRLCRCMNIPARYCTGYLGDIGVPPVDAPMDFSRLVRGLSRRRLVHLRCAPQHAAHRPHPDGARPRRDRHRADDRVRPGQLVSRFEVHTDEVESIGVTDLLLEALRTAVRRAALRPDRRPRHSCPAIRRPRIAAARARDRRDPRPIPPRRISTTRSSRSNAPARRLARVRRMFWTLASAQAVATRSGRSKAKWPPARRARHRDRA